MDKILSGKDGEEKACNYVKSKKYKILERNCRCTYGEIDIIAKDNNISNPNIIHPGQRLIIY